MAQSAAAFWQTYASKNLDPQFKDLCQNILQENPATRPTMADLITHPWMTGEQATKEQFANSCKLLIQQAQQARDREAEGVDFNISTAGRRRRGGDQRGSDTVFPEGFTREFKPLEDMAFRRFEVNGSNARGIIMELYDIVSDKVTKEITISNNTWKLTFEGGYKEPEEEGEGQQ